jgi:hypothetical protein
MHKRNKDFKMPKSKLHVVIPIYSEAKFIAR